MSFAQAKLSSPGGSHESKHGLLPDSAISNKRVDLAWVLIAHPDDVVAKATTAGKQLLSRPTSKFGAVCKRALDVPIALAALILLAPAMILIAAIMKITDRGPVFYGHTRIGREGRPFRCFKFRTMVVDADERLRRFLAEDHQLAEQWNATRKLACDPRITRLGWFLRKTSFDELPQLINVLGGEMSCVGPRPVTAEELERYGEVLKDYVSVRPGITGLWQVCGRSQCLYTERIALDHLYVRAWSFRLDLAILLRTIPTVLNFSRTA